MNDFLSAIDNGAELIPDWVIALTVIALAVGVVLALHRIGYALLLRMLRHSGFTTPVVIVSRTKGPTRLAIVILTMALVLPATPIDADVGALLARVMRIAFIALLCWIAVVAVDISTGIYLRRFNLDAEDNLVARKHTTQVRILRRAFEVVIVVIGVAAALMTFDQVREIGISLFASAGVAGLAIGLAARPLLSSLIAGIQIAVTQPIRIDDVLIVEGEYGTVEEITSTYVVIKLWDWRRMILPLSYFIEKPFQNWTRETSSIIGSVMIEVDYSAPVEAIRRQLTEIVEASARWDRRVVNLQVVEARESTMQLRALVSARTAPLAWDLRCEVREKLIAFLQTDYPDALPHLRLGRERGLATAAAGGLTEEDRSTKHEAAGAPG